MPVDLSGIADITQLESIAYKQMRVIAAGQQAQEVLQACEGRIAQIQGEQREAAALEAKRLYDETLAQTKPPPRAERRIKPVKAAKKARPVKKAAKKVAAARKRT